MGRFEILGMGKKMAMNSSLRKMFAAMSGLVVAIGLVSLTGCGERRERVTVIEHDRGPDRTVIVTPREERRVIVAPAPREERVIVVPREHERKRVVIHKEERCEKPTRVVIRKKDHDDKKIVIHKKEGRDGRRVKVKIKKDD
jgi:hypothetical protein